MKKSMKFLFIGLFALVAIGCKKAPEQPVHVHSYGDPTYTWSLDNSTCTAKRVCLLNSEHVLEETVNSTYEVVTAPTYVADGLGRYTAVFPNLPTQTKDVVIPKLVDDETRYQVSEANWASVINPFYKNVTINFVLEGSMNGDGLIEFLADGSLHQDHLAGWGEVFMRYHSVEHGWVEWDKNNNVWNINDDYKDQSYYENNKYGDDVGVLGRNNNPFNGNLDYSHGYTYHSDTHSYTASDISWFYATFDITLKFEDQKLISVDMVSTAQTFHITFTNYGTTSITWPADF